MQGGHEEQRWSWRSTQAKLDLAEFQPQASPLEVYLHANKSRMFLAGASLCFDFLKVRLHDVRLFSNASSEN